jgi:hypothetical protein
MQTYLKWFYTLTLIFLIMAACSIAGHCASCPRGCVHRRHSAPKRGVLFPKHGSLALQNVEANKLGLPRVRNGAALRELVAAGIVIPLPLGPSLRSTVPQDRAFLLPWTAALLSALADDEYMVFHKPLTVSSALRPLDVQRRLRRYNRAAAPASGPLASVHPAGIAFDIGKRTLAPAQRHWLAWRLWYLQAIGRAIVLDERACFHVVTLRADGNQPISGKAAGIAPFFGVSVAAFDPPALF